MRCTCTSSVWPVFLKICNLIKLQNLIAEIEIDPEKRRYEKSPLGKTVMNGFCFVVYLLGPRMSLISTLRKGRKGFPQKGQVVFRLESSAVQPAMISSSYTRQSHVLQREQLEISSWNQRQRDRVKRIKPKREIQQHMLNGKKYILKDV